MKQIFFTLSLCLFSTISFANLITEIWDSFEKNDLVLARQLIDKALEKEETKVDASMILMLLNSIEVKEGNMVIAERIIPEIENPNPYLFAFWHDEAINYGYGKKTPEREKFLLSLLNSGQLNAANTGSLQYMLGMHYGFSNNYSDAKAIWKPIFDIKGWQFVGPFDNALGSGFNKSFGPINHPEPNAVFSSKNDADIKWFTPKIPDFQPWIGTGFYIPDETAIIYAQNFIQLEEEQELLFTFGFAGNIKVWVNDVLVLNYEEEIRTDLDFLKTKVRVPKGNNRVLVQLGHTSKTQYPNFMLRVFDAEEKVIYPKTTSKYSKYNKGKATLISNDYPHFAESYFLQKIQKEPENIINHILLSKTYYRSSKFNDAIKVLQKARKLYPQNIFVNYELLYNYYSIDDRTKISKQTEVLRKVGADICFFPIFDYEINMGTKDLSKLEKILTQMKACIGEEHEEYYSYYLNFLTEKKEYQKLIEVAEMAYEKYPENQTFLILKFNILNSVKQEPQAAINLLEEYLEKNYDFKIYNLLKDEYAKQKNNEKVEEILLKIYNFYPADSKGLNNVIKYYFKTEEYTKALEYVDLGLGNTPYLARFWSDRAHINYALGDKNAAIEDLKKTINYNRNAFAERDRLREFQGKPTILSLVKDNDREEQILKKLELPLTSEENYEYLFYDKSVVVYPEGSSSAFYTIGFQIYTEEGINQWKEASIPFSSSSENLAINKAEVYKKNGEKLLAEQNKNQFVFTSLEIGDIIWVDYQIDKYRFGNLAKEFWTEYTFNDYYPMKEARFRIFADKNYPLYFTYHNLEEKSQKKDLGDFVCYEWVFTDLEGIEEENFMPTLAESAMTLSISSLDSWTRIAEWYRDLSMPQAKADYNLEEVYESIFAGRNNLSDEEIAIAIYEYITSNIQYSSVSFRQSNYVPQKPMVTISTKLGDCKDVSTLYHTLANKAGLSTNLVLVNTRDNGEEKIMQPSIEFNHCIIKINLPEGELYQELTDNNLPFGAIPNSIQNAQALVIPTKINTNYKADLINIPTNALVNNSYNRIVVATIEDKGLLVDTEVHVTGKVSSSYRSHFADLTKESTKDKVKALIADYFPTDIILGEYKFENLNNLDPNFVFHTDYKVNNATLSIGGIKAMKIPFMEQLFALDDFPIEERNHPLLYWKYESADSYDASITLNIPGNSKIIELPSDLTIKNKFINYSLSIEKLSEGKIKIRRKATLNRLKIEQSEYTDFRAAVEKIIAAEDAYIAFK